MKRAIKTIAGMGMAFLIGISTVAGHTPHNVAVDSDIPSYAQLLYETGNCWVNDGKPHPFPNQAIVILINGDASIAETHSAVDNAINQVMGKGGPFKSVYAFCKE